MTQQARDLVADLAICEAATLGPWMASELDKGVLIVRDSAEFIAQAREGWPYAIRRAQQAEREYDRIHNELNILQEKLRCSGRCRD